LLILKLECDAQFHSKGYAGAHGKSDFASSDFQSLYGILVTHLHTDEDM